jgi:hypothetical protein
MDTQSRQTSLSIHRASAHAEEQSKHEGCSFLARVEVERREEDLIRLTARLLKLNV